MANVQKTYALILGLVLLVIGIWGFFQPVILGLFGVNEFQSVLHVIAGLFGLYVGTAGIGRGYNLTIGWIGVILGAAGFIPGVTDLLFSLLAINTEITILHLVIGVLSLVVGYGVKAK